MKHSTSAWIESHVDVGRNRKILAFARRLGIPVAHAIGHLHLLWHAILEQQEDGIVTDWLPEELAQAAHYQNSDPNAFREALITENLLDESDGEFIVHDWFDYAGRYLTRKYSSHKARRLKKIKQLYKVSPRRHRGATTVTPRCHRGDTLVDAEYPPDPPDRTVPIKTGFFFEKLWEGSWHRGAKKAAERKFKARLKAKDATPEELCEAVQHRRQAYERSKTEPRFQQNVATFLGPDEHWKKWVKGIPPEEDHQGGKAQEPPEPPWQEPAWAKEGNKADESK